MYFLSVVLIGTTYPIFLEVISSEKISVGPPFYNKLLIPFLIPFLLAMSIGPKLKWIKSNLEKKINLTIFFLISILLSSLIISISNEKFLINTLLISGALFLFFVTLRDFFISGNKNISQNFAHFGFSILILSILLNNYFSKEVITNLKIGETFKSNDLSINFESVNYEKKQNFEKIVGNFKIENSRGEIEVLNPELRIYNQPKTITSEADIKTNLLSDKFMTMNIVQNEEYFNIRYQTKPLMIWIWISVLIISIGGITSVFKKNEK
tara:strand:- start:432 stop:1232 length:801 start_codon:yes stop_codon:yes gene_type:complete